MPASSISLPTAKDYSTTEATAAAAESTAAVAAESTTAAAESTTAVAESTTSATKLSTVATASSPFCSAGFVSHDAKANADTTAKNKTTFFIFFIIKKLNNVFSEFL